MQRYDTVNGGAIYFIGHCDFGVVTVQNAAAVAKLLNEHPAVERVVYPGLPSHPQYEVACRQMSGFGGMITFYIKVWKYFVVYMKSHKYVETVVIAFCSASIFAALL